MLYSVLKEKEPEMKITFKQARENLPAEVAAAAILAAKNGKTNRIGFELQTEIYFGEDGRYSCWNGETWTGLECGGEWNGYKANDPINKTAPIPVGAYIVSRQWFLGHLSVTVIHNNGVMQVR